ncbi:hypothetical protein JCM11491_000228, partial [Sporobolomyces phaffii]
MSPTPPAALCSLPPEVVLRILRLFLDPRSLSRLAQTCTRLHDLARSDLVWRDVVLALVAAHAVPSGAPFGFGSHLVDRAPDRRSSSSWFDHAQFLLPHARHLGYFASSIPFTSRIVRVAIVESNGAYAIHAAQLRPSNRYSVTNPPPRDVLPAGAHLDITLDAYTISRAENPSHPDAGISTDVLCPAYDFTAAMVDITPHDGAVLSSSPHRAQLQLGLALEPTVQPVYYGRDARSRTANGFERDPHAELSREALLALFSGRLPRRPWPTLELVGIDHDGDGDSDDRRRLRTNDSGA